jgi:hypothetical protein
LLVYECVCRFESALVDRLVMLAAVDERAFETTDAFIHEMG